jgi:hypothetical protein
VHVFEPDGTLAGKLRTPEVAANLCFGGTNQEMIFITASTALYGITRMPDFAVTAINRHPATFVEGQPVRFSVVVKNQGTAPTPEGKSTRVTVSLGTNSPILWADGFARTIPPDGSAVILCDAGVQGNGWTAAAGPSRIRASVDPDNELAESNETNNVLAVTFSVPARPADTDQDGLSDPDEASAGTDPGLSASVLRIIRVEQSTPGQWTLGWSSVPGKAYRIAYKSALGDPDWNDLGEPVTASEPTSSWTRPLPASGQLFFRIRLVQ